jgi:hypothetical protein
MSFEWMQKGNLLAEFSGFPSVQNKTKTSGLAGFDVNIYHTQ